MHTTRDLANLLQLMQTSRQSGDLIIEPQVQSGTAWRGQIRLVDGQVTACQIRSKLDGRLGFRDNDAMRWLMNPERGKLQWSLEEPPPPSKTFLPVLPTEDDTRSDEQSGMDRMNPYSTVPGNPPGNSNRRNTYPARQNDTPGPSSSGPSLPPGAVLKRTELGNKAPGFALSSRELRQVFALVDGHRTVEEIVRLLHKSPDSVMRLLSELKATKLLE